MLKRPIIIVIAVLVAAASIAIYFVYRVPPGVAAKGGGAELVQWASLASSAISILVAVTGSALKVIDRLAGRGK